jgi:hypothetical protein
VTTVLSSRWTAFSKFAFPALWGGGWSYFTALLFTDPSRISWQGGGAPPPWAKWVFLAILVGGGEMCRRVCVPLKRVILEDGYLRISNYRHEIHVPVSEVQRAGFDAGAEVNGKRLVGLEFHSETPFGRAIEFIPRSPDAIEVLRARLGPAVGGPREPPEDDLSPELRGRGTV